MRIGYDGDGRDTRESEGDFVTVTILRTITKTGDGNGQSRKDSEVRHREGNQEHG